MIGLGGELIPSLNTATKSSSSITSLFGSSMSLPIPPLSFTGGAAAPSNAASGAGGNVNFGNVRSGIGFWGAIAVVAGIIIWKKLK